MTACSRSIFRKTSCCESARFSTDFVLLDGAGRILRGLNQTAARVWELIDGKSSVAQIAERISDEFHAPQDQVLADVLSFLSALMEKKLLQPAEAVSERG